MSKIIVGLGNPGKKYTWTRHNLGFLVLDALAEKYQKSWGQSAGIQADISKIKSDNCHCSLMKPTTFMNVSGLAVKPLVAKQGVGLENILVVCDDLSLPFGQVRLRSSGTAGGHNGLKSIIEQLGSKDFARLRLGIGRPAVGVDTADYVLQDFTPVEKKALPDFINQALNCVTSWVTDGANEAMNQFNQRKINE